MHKLLIRQLKRFNLDNPERNFGECGRAFIEAVNQAYCQADQDRQLLERSLDLTSRELTARNSELKQRLTELESTRTHLEDSLSTLHTTFDAIGEAILAFDERGRLVKYNQVALDMLQLKADPSRDLAFQVLIYLYRTLKDPAVLIHTLRYIDEEPDCVLSGLLEFRDGSFYEYHTSAKCSGSQLLGRVWSFRNITEVKKNQAFIQHQAYHDALTNLPNRPLFLDRLQHAISYAQRDNRLAAVLYVDLDHFKKVNDTCGHHQGDVLLKEVAARISRCQREHDTLARLGGDEFVLLLEGLQSYGMATTLCHRILHALKDPFFLEKHRFYISCSIGISIFPRDGVEPQELIRKADMAMYHAKELGRNGYQYFSESLERLALHHVELEHRLREAIQNQELSVYYQPKVDTFSQKVIGAEALLRWFPPGKKPISPMEFIPIAEQTGLINALGSWVLEQVCCQLATWRHLGIDTIPVSVNLSTRELLDRQLLPRIRDTLKKYGIPAHLLAIEITETVLMENLEYTQNVLHELRNLGIAIAVDDFGTGYSSMRYLQRLPIDFLKVDKSFILDLSQNKQNAAIASSIITLAHNLNMGVVAEGVEDEITLNFLRAQGCDQVQGFHLYRPLDIKRMEALLLEEVGHLTSDVR